MHLKILHLFAFISVANGHSGQPRDQCIKKDSLKQCKRLCQITPECTSFTYYSENYDGNDGTGKRKCCYLVDKSDEIHAEEKCLIGKIFYNSYIVFNYKCFIFYIRENNAINVI